MRETLLASLLFVHFAADFTHLNSAWMLQAKKHGKPLFPILVHGAVHGLLLGIVLLVFGFSFTAILLPVLVQTISHFLLDTLKGRLHHLFPVAADIHQRPYWYIMGIDQFLHLLIILWITFYLQG